MRVAIANSHEQEVNELRSILDNSFETYTISESDLPEDIIGKSDLVVIDSNFTANQGIDLLMNIESVSNVPILVIVPSNDQRVAVESMRAGAMSFLVKTNDYSSLLPTVINDIYTQFNDNKELKRMVEALEERIHSLEAQIEPPSGIAKPVPLQQANIAEVNRSRILAQITLRLKKGEITLPIYPDMSSKFDSLLRNNADMIEITRLLESDASLTSKLISVANSPLNRGVTEASTLEQAINRLGLISTKNYVEVITNRALYTSNDKKYKELLDDLFQHSLACAHAANAIAVKLKLKDPGVIFTMAMLHDIGKLFLIQILSEIGTLEPSVNELTKDEVNDFLFETHAQFGEVLLKRWKLPAEIIDVVKQVEIGTDIDTTSLSKPLCIVNFADLLAEKLGYGTDHHADQDITKAISTEYLKFTSNDIDEFSNEVMALMQDSEF